MNFDVSQEESGSKGRFFIHDGKTDIAELTYSKAGEDRIIIDHTHVDESHRGEDLGKKMVYKAVDYARKKGLKIIPLCPFANSVFKKHQEIQDVL
jgi:predicted GNAT family acetyltransferase